MGVFSFFRDKSELDKSQYGEYFTKDLIWNIVDSSSSMMLFFTKKDGWIGANQVFLNTFGFKNIEEFRFAARQFQFHTALVGSPVRPYGTLGNNIGELGNIRSIAARFTLFILRSRQSVSR